MGLLIDAMLHWLERERVFDVTPIFNVFKGEIVFRVV